MGLFNPFDALSQDSLLPLDRVEENLPPNIQPQPGIEPPPLQHQQQQLILQQPQQQQHQFHNIKNIKSPDMGELNLK